MGAEWNVERSQNYFVNWLAVKHSTLWKSSWELKEFFQVEKTKFKAKRQLCSLIIDVSYFCCSYIDLSVYILHVEIAAKMLNTVMNILWFRMDSILWAIFTLQSSTHLIWDQEDGQWFRSMLHGRSLITGTYVPV
jgi:hypothetical protein